jgi:hypothetical protein
VSTKISQWAPIALFIYKRPEHARRTIASLKVCAGYEESPLYVFADGPKTGAEVPAVQATRAAARELLGTRAVFVEQDQNRGLANSIIAGTTELCERHGRVVVVEDDLTLGPSFLRFLNEGLERYEDEPRVMHVAGHMFDVPSLADTREALFLPLTSSWGWATWKRAWDQFDPSASGWQERLVGEEAERFDLGGRYDYSRMLRRQMSGRIDSWAIRWYYTVFARDGLALYPPQTLVLNEGFDGTGTHDRLSLPVRQARLEPNAAFDFPTQVVESPEKERVFEAISSFRSASAPQKLRAVAQAVLRSAGLANSRGHLSSDQGRSTGRAVPTVDAVSPPMSLGSGHLTPIALFIYRRPDHTRRMIEHLQRCRGFGDSLVYVFADGPKHSREAPSIQETRSEARRLLGDRAVFLERDTNVGVDNSIIEGVTQLCERYGRVIVVEDDLVVSPFFLEFLNAGLRRYENEPRVMQVCGYMFDVPGLRESRDAVFLPMISSWGWATWKRAWDLYDPTARGWTARLGDERERRRFDLDGNFEYAKMLSQQMRRAVPAWDIRWYYTVFARDGLALYPPQTLVLNEGFDGTGTHGRLSLPVRQARLEANAAFDFPTQVVESPEKERVFEAIRSFRSASAPQKLRAVAQAVLRSASGR